MTILVWYLVLFVPQLLIGAGIGWWYARWNGQAGGGNDDAAKLAAQREDELRDALGRLKLLTDSVQDDVRQHAEKVDSSSKELADVKPGDGDSAMAALAPIVKANEELQQRLRETEKKLAEQSEQLEEQVAEARTDPLTGLLNRRGMETHLPKLYDAFKESQQSFCMTILDIDRFKKFNDEYGHDIGDMVLCEVARIVNGAVRRDDIVARFGGEEFVILSPDTDLHEAGRLLERVRTAVEENVVDDEVGELKVTISLGVAQIGCSESNGVEDSAAILKRADTALYAAKEGGRNRSYCHDGQDVHPLRLNESEENVDAGANPDDGLPNAASFQDELKRRVAESARSKTEVSLISFGIDNIEKIAEEHGGDTAQLVRRGVGKFLANIMREMDLVARSDDDRFSIMLPSCSIDDAARVADRVRLTASQTPFRTAEDIELQLTLSAGVTTAGADESPETITARCQAALEKSLTSGGDCSTIEEPAVDVEESESRELVGAADDS